LRRTDPTSKEFYEISEKSIYKTRKWITLGTQARSETPYKKKKKERRKERKKERKKNH